MKCYNPPLEGRRGSDCLLLDFNERTTPYGDVIKKALEKMLTEDKMQIYPEYGNVAKEIANYTKTKPQNIIITNGSDQAIDLVFRTFTKTNDEVIIPSPSFAMFYQCAKSVGNKIISPLYKGKNLSFPTQETLDKINSNTKLIIICNPNNPTGTLVSVKDIEAIIRKAPKAVVLVDEAYAEFSGVTTIPLIKKYKNLIITRTFSKAFGLAALRIGYAIGNQKTLVEMMKVRGPYDINMPALCAAKAALKNLNPLYSYVDEVMNISKPMLENYFKKEKIKFYPSQANFILFIPRDASQTFEYLKNKNFLTRPRNDGLIKDTIRVTLGTAQQTAEFINAYKKIIQKNQKKYVFIDRDGTLIYEPTPKDTKLGDIPYQIDSFDKLKILPGVIEGLQELINKKYRLVLISNQDGLGTKNFPQANFDGAQNKMLKIFKDNEIEFEEIFICSHLPEDNCNCRKPKTGLLDNFIKNKNIDWKKSIVIGNSNADKGLAKNLKLKFIKIKTNQAFKLNI